MALPELTTYKYIIEGDGQTRGWIDRIPWAYIGALNKYYLYTYNDLSLSLPKQKKISSSRSKAIKTKEPFWWWNVTMPDISSFPTSYQWTFVITTFLTAALWISKVLLPAITLTPSDASAQFLLQKVIYTDLGKNIYWPSKVSISVFFS